MRTYPAWDDPSLAVESDTTWRARYRRLQSWYREERLSAAPGPSGDRALVGSMLAKKDVAARPNLNFFDAAVATYATERAQQVKALNGTLELNRVKHNMLSSMPLCFNLFGYLRRHKKDTATVLCRALALPIAQVEEIEVEWVPADEGEGRIGDRTAFDAFIRYRAADGRRGFIGVETKYTEPFSTTKYDSSAYRKLTRPPVFKAKEAADRLLRPATNQLWRNLLLALNVRDKQGFDLAHVAVLACAGDAKAKAAVDGVREELTAPDDYVRALTFDDLVPRFSQHRGTHEWATWFRERYLDWERVTPTP